MYSLQPINKKITKWKTLTPRISNSIGIRKKPESVKGDRIGKIKVEILSHRDKLKHCRTIGFVTDPVSVLNMLIKCMNNKMAEDTRYCKHILPLTYSTKHVIVWVRKIGFQYGNYYLFPNMILIFYFLIYFRIMFSNMIFYKLVFFVKQKYLFKIYYIWNL